MKAIVLLIGVTLTSIIAVSRADKNISGTWIMQQGDNPANPPVLRIRMGEGIWEGKIDMPEQQVYDRRVESIRVDGDSVFITVYKGGPVIAAKCINENSIRGVLQGETATDPVALQKQISKP